MKTEIANDGPVHCVVRCKSTAKHPQATPINLRIFEICSAESTVTAVGAQTPLHTEHGYLFISQQKLLEKQWTLWTDPLLNVL